MKKLKKYCIGFVCCTKLDEHYTEASHRIFLVTEFGMVTIFWFDKTNKIICKSNKFIDKIKNDAIMSKML